MTSLAYNPAYVPTPIIAAQCGGAEIFSFVGDVIVNGVNMPLQVLEQLRQAGISAISWLNASELQDAVQACKYDATLIDDHRGGNLRDKMTLTFAEQQARRPVRKKAQSFEEMIKEERALNKEHAEEEHEPAFGGFF